MIDDNHLLYEKRIAILLPDSDFFQIPLSERHKNNDTKDIELARDKKRL